MKALLFSLILAVMPSLLFAQNTSPDNGHDLFNVQEDPEKTVVTFPGGRLEVNEMGDTITRIQIGQRRFEILENVPNGSTRIRMVHVPRDRFKGHWAGFDLGFNNFLSSHFNSQLPDEAMFMDLNTSKSVAVGLNLLQYSIGLQRNHNNIGLITGMGLTYNNYRLDSPNILMKDAEGHTSYEETTRDVKKNKLTTAFLTVPLLMEVQIPTASEHPFFINGGLYGGFKLGSHTKVVYANSDEKEKSHSDLNVNSFKYGATIRFGYRFLKLHASCDLSQLFQAGQGPRLYPWTVGLTLVNF